MTCFQIRLRQIWGGAWLFLLLFFADLAHGQELVDVLEIEAEQSSQSLSGHVEVLFDPGGELEREDVLVSAEWEDVGTQPYTKGLDEGTAWLRFRLENPTDQTLERVVQISHGLSDEVTAWIQDGDGQTQRFDAGENTELQDRPMGHFYPRFPLELAPGEQVEVLLRMTDEGTMSAPLEVATLDYLQAMEGSRQWINGLMSGVFGLVGFYSLVLFVRMRRRIFGWLSALAAASLLQWMFYHWGHAGLWLPADVRPWVVNRVIVGCFELAAFCSFFFYIVACELEAHRPRLTRVIKGFAWLGLANAALIFFLPYSLGVGILFLGPLGLVILSIAILIRAVRGDPVSQRLTLAALLLMLGYSLTVFTESGVLPRTWLSVWYIPLGTLSQWLLLSEAVALRARQMVEERRAALEAQLAEERRSGELREAFGRYVAPDLAEKILEDPEAMALGGRLQTVTILMSDLRGFTGMTRRLGPPAMCALLNDYLGRMTEVIERHGGWVNEFIGDAILTLFGTPVASEEDSLSASRCAIEMQIVLSLMNDELRAAGRPTLEMGIGLHTGEAVVGNIGSERRVKWGVIGDTVNMTARIESLTIGTQILISADLLDQVAPHVVCGPRREVRVKGRTRLLEVAELRAVPGSQLAMPESSGKQLSDADCAGEVYRLKGKELAAEPEHVRIIRLGPAGMVFEGEAEFVDGTDLALRVSRGSDWTEPIYGKVRELEDDPSRETGQIAVAFTSVDPVTRAWLEETES